MSIELQQAAQFLREGKLVAFPTETVYGLGGNAINDRAVAEIYAVKGRPQFNPLIVHLPDADTAREYVRWNDYADRLAARFWPGALTLVLPRMANCKISLLASAGLDTLAVRVPAHKLAQDLLHAAGVPVAAPSANRSGRVSPTTAQHVRDEFADAVAVLDGGACTVGLESTVVDITSAPVLLRPGSVTKEELERALDCTVQLHSGKGDKHSPGMLESHYAPSLPLRLNAREAREDEALLAFGAHKGALNLSEKGDLKEAAANLFAHLRALDSPKYKGIAVMPIPEDGLGAAINDRLKRAAH